MVQQVIAAPGNSKGSASHAVLPEPDPTTFVNVTLGNKVFINKVRRHRFRQLYFFTTGFVYFRDW